MRTFPSLRRRIFAAFNFSRSHTSLRSPSHSLEVGSNQLISENPFFCLLNLCRSQSALRKIHALLIVSGEAGDLFLKEKLIVSYGMFGRIKDARLVFDEIPDPGLASCKVMMRWYFMNDLYSEVIKFYRFMIRTFLVVDNMVFSIVLRACSELREFREGRKLHGYIFHVGTPDSFVLTGLVGLYAKCGDVCTARKAFEMIGDRDVICWTSMIVGYVQNNCVEEGLLLFNHMRDCLIEGSSYTLGSLVTACGKLGALHQGRWLHGNVIKNGIEVNSWLFTSLLDMYVKCGAIHDAELVFDEFCFVDLVSWTAMITGYAQNGYAEEALLLFTNKRWQDVYPNAVTLRSVLLSCGQLGDPDVGSSFHSLAIKLGQDDTNVMNGVLDMYMKCCSLGAAVSLFESMLDKDADSWSLIIRGYYQNGCAHEALRMFRSMKLNCFCPDPVTLATVLSSCGSTEDIRFGSSLHAYTIRQGYWASKSVHVGTALVSLYAKCGDAKSARHVREECSHMECSDWWV